MVFSSTVFLFAFLPLLFLFYFMAAEKWRNYVLLIFSLVFYAWGEPKFLPVMIILVMLDYIFAICIGRTEKIQRKKIYVAATVVSNLGLLGYYKYTKFVLENVNVFLQKNITIPDIVLPIGISFFTFQAMSYVLDVYRGDAKVQKNPFYVLLYVSLFPQLVAGPIVRYQTVEEEIVSRKTTAADFSEGLERFIIGFGKKIIISNNAAVVVDNIFGASKIDASMAWLAVIGYGLQIYFDFSAYSDMAIGLGRILGFHFKENFDFPYISQSATEFWRRWHISLSSWFRDYVYIPLGGNRKGVKRQIFNMFVVWALTGIWHGAAWTYIVWGLYFFVLLVLEKYVLHSFLEKLPRIVRHLYFFFCINISWALFRGEDLSQAWWVVKHMLRMHVTTDGWAMTNMYLHQYGLYLVLGVIFCAPVYRILKEKMSKVKAEKTRILLQGINYAGLLVLFFVSILYLVNSSYNPFIYFRF
ncbi:MAG: MBOAT family O-acyltransferase [Lachnospiraceae bacterium]|nr:MBOAT family O-acyltransferase [Lachnospiraceae bacterium]